MQGIGPARKSKVTRRRFGRKPFRTLPQTALAWLQRSTVAEHPPHTPTNPDKAGLRIRVRGQVQGVGFRPFIWQLAQEFELRGRVMNDPEGVLIDVWGDATDFVQAISARAPLLARVDMVEVSVLLGHPPVGFSIAPSQGMGALTRVTPDAATCPACLAEMAAPGRRQGYAFTNCTDCGPRFSILRGLPYDRAQTTMAPFVMCPDCRAEYDDPADRRFHAQPIACPICGPRLWFEMAGQEQPGDPIAQAVALMRRGGILAVKGLGGFHLACDASNPQALALLRQRKHRPTKPFAVMAAAPILDRIARLTDADHALLADPTAPIVIVPTRRRLPHGIAPGLTTLGVMRPATPLHHLLIDVFGDVLVMTSGNAAGELQMTGNAEARAKLGAIADGFLMHDRDIARRLDDSVERAAPPMILRRARGRVPGTLPVPSGLPDGQILALGGQMKGAICMVRNGQALLSQHLGDLDRALCLDDFHRTLADYRDLFDQSPAFVAVDAHPGYSATRAGHAMGLPVIEVWHHHAHLAACLAENLWPADGGMVAGIVLDGAGLGPDGTIWGGELLLGDYHGFERRAYLAPVPLPGGDRAAREPWRNLLAQLDRAGLPGLADALLPDAPRDVLRQAIRAGVNAPLSSSAGRLFDAFAAATGFSGAQTYEGEAAMMLEALAELSPDAGAGVDFTHDGPVIVPAPLWHDLAHALSQGIPLAHLALRFHASLARAFASRARALVETGEARAIAMTGGCFQNALMHHMTLAALGDLPVLTHRTTPANDGGLALGQAMVALARGE